MYTLFIGHEGAKRPKTGGYESFKLTVHYRLGHITIDRRFLVIRGNVV